MILQGPDFKNFDMPSDAVITEVANAVMNSAEALSDPSANAEQ